MTVLSFPITLCADIMMMWYENSFWITGPLWVESTSQRWIPLTKGLYCRAVIFSLLFTEQAVEQTKQSSCQPFEMPWSSWEPLGPVVTQRKWLETSQTSLCAWAISRKHSRYASEIKCFTIYDTLLECGKIIYQNRNCQYYKDNTVLIMEFQNLEKWAWYWKRPL